MNSFSNKNLYLVRKSIRDSGGGEYLDWNSDVYYSQWGRG